MTAADDAGPTEIVVRRLFDGPRDEVFRAFADPDRLRHWWGPNGFTNTFEQFDLRPGGLWTFVMHGPDGTDFPNERVFTEVVPPGRVVLENRVPPHEFRMTMTYEDRDGRTLLTWRMRFESADEFARVRAVIVPACEENFDRLRDHLAASRPAGTA